MASYQNRDGQVFDVDASRPLVRGTPVSPERSKINARVIALVVCVVLSVPLLVSYVSPSSQMLLSSSKTERLSLKKEEEKNAMFKEFQRVHGRTYKNDKEKASRYEVFKANLERIDGYNDEHAKLFGAKFHVTKFADLTHEEYLSYNSLHYDHLAAYKETMSMNEDKLAMLGYKHHSKVFEKLPKHRNLQSNAFMDWRPLGAVTPVKNQGNCGGCWAFAATGNVEGVFQAELNKGPYANTLISLSEEQLLDCTPGSSCAGGTFLAALSYINKVGSINSETGYQTLTGLPSVYPAGVSGVSATKCPLPSTAPPAITYINGWTSITPSEPTTAAGIANLQTVLRWHAPVAVAVDATNWQFYVGGIFACSTTFALNHAVTIVGYGQLQGVGYWIAKNSWGTTWGMQTAGNQGYMYISTTNDCGVLAMPTTAFM